VIAISGKTSVLPQELRIKGAHRTAYIRRQLIGPESAAQTDNVESFCDGSLQFRLIVFHHEQVIAIAIVNGSAGFPLAEYGVTGKKQHLQGAIPSEI
jgi:hypothetical protein